MMKQQGDRTTEYHDTSRIFRYVQQTKHETEPELLLYLCVPAVLVGTLFRAYQMYYIALFVACSSFLGCKYGEVNVQQYISMGMMIVMATTMQFMQPGGGSRMNSQGAPPQPQPTGLQPSS
ncbi:hypothetical protein, conserved [Eimeria necatrix]|uniref:Uncharacterized protein n=1 Tax=Eimeria necatrix TaxID=51315 RepID=U6MS62_9EIME|nr:hypothetical protein, conserved [Eimeria necatrix]CDJ66856.1 hypothetical protein, conserved [Eimeria necatrix]